MRRAVVILALVAVAAALASCGGGPPSRDRASTSVDATGVPVGSQTASGAWGVQGLSVDAFYASSCASCHGVDRSGGVGPPLTVDALTGSDERYAEAIRDGRSGTAMPAWSSVGLTEAEIGTLVAYLRGDPANASSSAVPGQLASELDGVSAPSVVDVGRIELGTAAQADWRIRNESGSPVAVTSVASPTRTVFHLGALPVRIGAGESASLRLAFAPGDATGPGDAAGVAIASFERLDGGAAAAIRVAVEAELAPPERSLAFSDLRLDSFPVRVATWGSYLYVALWGGTIEIYEFDGGELALVEQVTSIAATPNHGPDGAAQPDVEGRLIGGLAVDEVGTLYVTHADPRLNEGEYSRDGHLADLNSGTVTALAGGPRRYDQPGSRRDLVRGLPRNVTNHIPSALAAGPDGWLYVALGSMTDSGVPDPSKPDADTELSGSILRIRASASPDAFPVVLASPGGPFATQDALVEGVVELYATGVRNGFGLAFTAPGQLYLTDQGSDGGSAPRPLGADGPAGISSNLGADHLHRVQPGAYLGQPNIARGELVLDDGSGYSAPVVSSGYSPPAHLFGIHSSATGLAEYRGALFPDLDGWMLVGKFSGTLGLQAIRLEDGRVVESRVLTRPPTTRNVTDVAVGPDGEIVIAEFWESRLRISRGYE